MGLSGEPQAETKLTQLQGSITRAPLQTETGIYSRKNLESGELSSLKIGLMPKGVIFLFRN